MSEELIKVKALSLDGVIVPYPCGISFGIDEETGFGKTTLIYVTKPDDCNIAGELIKENYSKPTIMLVTD